MERRLSWTSRTHWQKSSSSVNSIGKIRSEKAHGHEKALTVATTTTYHSGRRWSLTEHTLCLIIEFRGRISTSKFDMDDRSLYSGLIRLHILHHAAERPLYGIWIAEELARHGYKLSAGTLYPILHGLERKGYLRSHKERNGRSARRVYQATPLGKSALRTGRKRLQELFGEMFGSKTG